MTKDALLTKDDIRMFIVSQLKKYSLVKNGYFTKTAISKKLGIDFRKLTKIIAENNIKYSCIKGSREFYELSKIIDVLNKLNIEVNCAIK